MVNNISTNVLTIVCLKFFILERFNIQNTFGKNPSPRAQRCHFAYRHNSSKLEHINV